MENASIIFIENSIDEAIKEMIEYHKKYLRESRPESLKGTYSPIYAGTVLRTFFEASTGFGPLDPEQWKTTGLMDSLVMDKLPCVKQGFMLRNTLTMLFFLYIRTVELHEPENVQFCHFDDVMKKVFTEMDAAFYTAEGVPKIETTEAVKKGLITAPLSTQEVIRLKRPEFNDDKTPIIRNVTEDKQIYRKAFNSYFFQQLASNNYYSKENLRENEKYAHILETLDEVTNQMILEHNIVKETAMKWDEYLTYSGNIIIFLLLIEFIKLSLS
jgi:hypothetical protein